eukprot:9495044-Pyramimonas_sp.AAC.1
MGPWLVYGATRCCADAVPRHTAAVRAAGNSNNHKIKIEGQKRLGQTQRGYVDAGSRNQRGWRQQASRGSEQRDGEEGCRQRARATLEDLSEEGPGTARKKRKQQRGSGQEEEEA